MRLSVVPNNLMPMRRDQSRMIPILTFEEIQKLNNLKRMSIIQDNPRKSIRPNTNKQHVRRQYPIDTNHSAVNRSQVHPPAPSTNNRIIKSPKKYFKDTVRSNTKETSRNIIGQNDQTEGCCAWLSHINIRNQQETDNQSKSPFRPNKYPHWKS